MFLTIAQEVANVFSNWADWVILGIAFSIYIIYILCYSIVLHHRWRINIKGEMKEAMAELYKSHSSVNQNIQDEISKINLSIAQMIKTKSESNVIFINAIKDKDTVLAHSFKTYNDDPEYNAFYVNCVKLEKDTRHDFGSLLMGRMILLADYKKYMIKRIKQKILNIFATKLPFSPIEDVSKLDISRKTVVFLDNVDNCKATNIKIILDIIKESFNNIDNLIIVCPINKMILTNVLQHYYSYIYLMSPEELKNDNVFNQYAQLTNSKVIDLE